MSKESRPWGSFIVLDEGDSFKVKRIVVNPGGQLSLQYHKYRSEHWTVVQGTATVILGEITKKLNVDESIQIPVGVKHSIRNEGERVLQLIEVQLGSYLGEDDIVRIKDIYGRE